MKGFRTLIINGAVVALTAVLTWAAGVEWSEYVSPTVAVIVVAGVNLGLRIITTTPIGRPD